MNVTYVLTAFVLAAAFLAGAFFAGEAFAAAFFAGAFFAGEALAFLAGVFFAGEAFAAFFAGAFLAGVFFAAAFLAGVFFAAAFLAGVFFAGETFAFFAGVAGSSVAFRLTGEGDGTGSTEKPREKIISYENSNKYLIKIIKNVLSIQLIVNHYNALKFK